MHLSKYNLNCNFRYFTGVCPVDVTLHQQCLYCTTFIWVCILKVVRRWRLIQILDEQNWTSVLVQHIYCATRTFIAWRWQYSCTFTAHLTPSKKRKQKYVLFKVCNRPLINNSVWLTLFCVDSSCFVLHHLWSPLLNWLPVTSSSSSSSSISRANSVSVCQLVVWSFVCLIVVFLWLYGSICCSFAFLWSFFCLFVVVSWIFVPHVTLQSFCIPLCSSVPVCVCVFTLCSSCCLFLSF